MQLHEEKIALYERMLKEKDEMMGRLERLIDLLVLSEYQQTKIVTMGQFIQMLDT
jgi:hypothetical protein